MLVGVYMMMGLKDVNYDDWTELIPAFLGFVMMPLSYSIATGIEFAIVGYVVIKLFSGRFKDLNVLLFILALIFMAKELLTIVM